MSLFACVLAGGRGERFWPLSRRERPKQLTNLTGEGTMLRLTVERLLPVIPPERILVVTSADLREQVMAETPMLPPTNIVGEPVGRNSAPAVALAARWVEDREPDATFLVAPSDHVIDGEAFRSALEAATAYAATHRDLVTFGVVPTRPETGYGYIEVGEEVEGAIHRAVGFREKPDRKTAEHYVDEGRYLWNSGMFVWKASTIRAAFGQYLPEVFRAAEGLQVEKSGAIVPETLARFYEDSPSISIDYGIMEKADNVVVCASEFAWCDVGSWSALADVVSTDDDGNVRIGLVETIDVRDSVFYSDGAPIAAIGVEGIVVVRVGATTLVCPKDRAESVRDLVRILETRPDWRRHL